MDGVENCIKLKKIIIIYGPAKDYTAISSLSNLEFFTSYPSTEVQDYNNLINALQFCDNLQTLRLSNYVIEDNMSSIKNLGNKLDYLVLNNCKITEISGLENKTNLTILNLVNNKIQKIQGLENLKQLKELDLSGNQIKDITPLAVNSALTKLNLRGNVEIDSNRNNYTGEKLEALNKIGEILDRNGSIYLDVDKLGLFTNYKSLNLSKQNRTDLKTLEGFTQLTDLNLYGNKITLKDKESQEILKSMKHLKNLDLSGNEVVDATAINTLEELTLLSVGGTFDLSQIEDIISNVRLVVSNETLKTIVNCDANKITTLGLNSAGVTELPDLSKLTKLEYLNLNDNKITDFSIISKVPSLKTLRLSSNLNLHGNMFEFSNLKKLENLELKGCQLWDEDLENLKVLKDNTNLTIDLSNNSIINATALLELNENTKINLSGNINLTKEVKEELKRHFQDRVTF